MKYNSLIIIPTYNEAENIEAVIKKVIDLEDKNDILVIDDNSPDGTSKIVENQKNIYNNRVFLIKREKKSGLGSAYKAGFKWALENNYSYIANNMRTLKGKAVRMAESKMNSFGESYFSDESNNMKQGWSMQDEYKRNFGN